MAEQFSASAAFTNMNNNTDGWGDDWGDWNETAPSTTMDSAAPKVMGPNGQQHPQHHPQPMNPMAGGSQYRDGMANRVDQQNHNYVPNHSAPQSAPWYQQSGFVPSSQHQHYPTQGYAPQTSYGQPNSFFTAPSMQPGSTPQRPPSHPAASTTPQLVPTFSQAISDSFDTSGNNSWNWSVPDTSKQPQSMPTVPADAMSKPKQPQQPPPQQQPYEDFPQPINVGGSVANAQLQRLKQETLSPQWSIESQVSSSDRSLESDPIGDQRGTSQPTTAMPSDEDISKGAAENAVNNVASAHMPQSSYGNVSYQKAPVGVPDKLDEVLEALTIKQEPLDVGGRSHENTYRGEQSFPPPPPSIAGTAAAAGPIVNESLSQVTKSSSTTPPLPPPPVDNTTVGPTVPTAGPPVAAGASTSAPPPLVSGPPPKAMQISSSNPFKRTAGRSHAATPGLGNQPTATPAPPANAGGPFFNQYQQPPLRQSWAAQDVNSVQSLTPENQEILVETVPREHVLENQEIAPNNDRNQYLQTGHLSEDGYGVEASSGSSGSSRALQRSAGLELGENANDSNDGRLPPPGLSRYVPGQNEQQPESMVQPGAGQSFPEPPPGLDRMVPGMDLQNASDLSLERQADGEVSENSSAPIMPSVVSINARNDHLHHHHNHGHGHHHHERVDMSDRNLYRVPGEDDNHNHHNQQQRVVPGGGLESDRPAPVPVAPVPVIVPAAASSSAAGVATLDMPEEQRELVMDGENPDDRREESLVGGNADAGHIASGPGPMASGISAGGIATVETESNVTADTSRMEPSNTSTADESEKGGFYPTGGSKGGRREDDNLRRSNKSKSSRDRYDTEDSEYSERDRRRRERESSHGAAGTSASGTGIEPGSHRHERSRHTRASAVGPTGDRENDKRRDNGRDRDKNRERDRDHDRDRDYDYRDRDRERNRYDRERERYGRSSKYDRESRYETDGSKYETERSTRYDKEDKRYGPTSRDDYYRKRDDRGPIEDGRAVSGRDRDRDPTDRRQRKEKERSDRYRGDDRRKDDRHRDGDKRRDRHDRRYDQEDYRAGSRNGNDRDRGRENRDDRKEKDRKYMGAAGGYGMTSSSSAYGPSSGYYDPYIYYAQHQQYYEQLRRTNPQAYAEFYRTYCAQMQANQLQRDLLATDGRESVHSGRSSANDKERFNRTTSFMHPPGLYNPEEYHRHFNNQSLPSAAASGGGGAAGPVSLLDQSYMTDMTGQPSSLPPMFHHVQAYQQHQTQHSLLHQQQQQQLHQRANTSLAMDRTYHSDAGGYFQPRLDQTDASAKPDTATELSMMEPERLTPRKFPEIHPIVNVSAGLLISTKNRLTMNGMADTVKIYSLGLNDASRKLFQTYPGPLVKGITHKKSVIEFCEEQLRLGPPYGGALALIKSRGNSVNSLHSSSQGANRSSFALLWNYIILLLRQNGTFVGTDISELLMRNKDEYPFEMLTANAIRSPNISGRNSSLSQAERPHREADAQRDGESEDALEPSLEGGQDSKELMSELTPKVLSEVEITDKFRNYLLYGNISEALEWATEHNLWGHALFLASKVDSRQHANVMMKFANKLTFNDPLQTLYQLFSGRTPASVTSVLDEKWGDWRPHLAMLMSNSSAKPELIKKSITTLGDTLLNRGDLYAAHFCYLLSDVAFGRFADVKPDVVGGGNSATVRLVLLGAAHHQRSFRELSTNESIMMTEIYEYARSLNEDRYTIKELQRYKYLLACRMLDQGMQLKCLLYMEQIAEQIQYDPYQFDGEFVRKIFTLGDRLKYYDPVMEKALDESVDNTGRGNIYANVEDPQWLKRLNEILVSVSSSSVGIASYNNGSDGQMSYDYSSHGYGGTDQTQAVGRDADQQPAVSESYPTETKDINEQFNEINQQLGQLNLQYSDQQQQQPQQQQQYQMSQQNAPSYETNTVPSYDQGYESINQQSLMDPHADHASTQLQEGNNFEQQQQQFSQYNSYDQHQQPAGAGIFTPAPPSIDTTGAMPTYDGGYWGAAENSEAPKPTISMPNSVSKRPGFGDDTDDDQRTRGPQVVPGQAQQPSTAAQQKKAPAAKDAKPAPGGAGGGAQGSGWFGGIWNKFSLKPKNQMILPDDKNPKIVWDEVSKRWVNTDENEAEVEAYKPPPKMADLVPAAMASANGPTSMGGPPGTVGLSAGPIQQPQPISTPTAPFQQTPNVMGDSGNMQMPSVHPMGNANVQQTNASSNPVANPAGEPTKVPTLQSNMYKMQRNRTLKRSYVDVFNPSGAAPSRPGDAPILAPAVPTMPSAPGGFLVPGNTPSATEAPQTNEITEGMPQFYNPNQFGGGYQQ